MKKTKSKFDQHFIDVISYETKKVERTLGPYGTKRLAESMDNGLNINLDHERYYTLIRSR